MESNQTPPSLLSPFKVAFFWLNQRQRCTGCNRIRLPAWHKPRVHLQNQDHKLKVPCGETNPVRRLGYPHDPQQYRHSGTQAALLSPPLGYSRSFKCNFESFNQNSVPSQRVIWIQGCRCVNPLIHSRAFCFREAQRHWLTIVLL